MSINVEGLVHYAIICRLVHFLLWQCDFFAFMCNLLNSLFRIAVEGEKKTDGGYKCTACDEEHDDLDEMQQHLMRHNDCKFHLSVHCLEGSTHFRK